RRHGSYSRATTDALAGREARGHSARRGEPYPTKGRRGSVRSRDSIGMKIYFDAVYTDLCRLVGYAGCLYRELWDRLRPAVDKHGQRAVESATAHLLTWEGQFTCSPKPLVQVQLRESVRRLARPLLGPPPEEWDEFYRHPDGTPDD